MLYTSLRQGFSLRACHSAQAHFTTLLPAGRPGPQGCKKQVRKCKDRLTRRFCGKTERRIPGHRWCRPRFQRIRTRAAVGRLKQECVLVLAILSVPAGVSDALLRSPDLVFFRISVCGMGLLQDLGPSFDRSLKWCPLPPCN